MMKRSRPQAEDFTVGWISALPIERTAAIEMLDEEYQGSDDATQYTLGRIGEHNVVVVCLPAGQIGASSAAIVAAEMRFKFPALQIGLMVGVGGGVPSPEADIRLGDVVISQPQGGYGGVVQYDFGKIGPGGIHTPTGFLNALPGVLLTAVNKLRSNISGGRCNIPAYLSSIAHLPEFDRRNAGPDILFYSCYSHIEGPTCGRCHNDMTVVRAPRRNKEVVVHYGTIASGNQVMKDGLTRENLSSELGGVLCFEMGAADLMNSFPYLVVRGICDYADSHQNKKWQPFAAAAAAACAKEILSYIPAASDSIGLTIDAIQPGISKYQGQNTPQPSELTEEERECLSIFYQADHATKLDYMTKLSNVPMREPQTCEWILQHPLFKDWLSESESMLLWISGNPGCGKTVISSFLIENFRQKASQNLIYFLFDSQVNVLRTEEAIVRALLHQLLNSNHLLLRHAVSHYRAMKSGLVTSVGTMWGILTEAIKDPNSGIIYCVLDGLDECEEDSRKRLISKLHHLISSAATYSGNSARRGFRMVIASRPWEDIQYGFTRIANIRLRTEIESAINDDINVFIQSSTDALASRRKYTKSLQEKVKNILLERANGMFLWVSLVVKRLESTPINDTERCLHELPSDLYGLYDQILDRISSAAAYRMSDIIMWVVTSQRSLTIAELAIALATRHVGLANLNDITAALEGDLPLCGPILNLQNGVISLIHQSAKDFFVEQRTTLSRQFYPGLRIAHLELAIACILYLSRDDFDAGPLEVEDWTEYYPEVGLNEKIAQHPFLQYSVSYWMQHINEARDVSEELKQAFTRFTQPGSGYLDSCMQLWYHFQHEEKNTPLCVTPLHLIPYFDQSSLSSILLEGEVDCSKKDGEDRTPLHWACERGSEVVVRILLDKNADIEAENCDGETPLHLAAGSVSDKILRLLLERGANIKARTYEQHTALHRAAWLGTYEVVRLLLEKGASINNDDTTARFESPLHFAAQFGSEALVRLLLDRGADVHSRDEYGCTPLHRASGNNEAVVKLLIEKGADVNAQSDYGKSILHELVWYSSEAMVKLLLGLGADVNVRDGQGRTLLHCAMERGERGTVNLLLELGVSVDARTDKGITALHMASSWGNEGNLKLLLDHVANVDVRSNDGITPLLFGLEEYGSEITTRLLLDRGANINARTLRGDTAIHCFARSGIGKRETLMKLLLKIGVDINARSSNGETALHVVVTGSEFRDLNEACVRLLVQEGIDVNAQDNDGRTALHLACACSTRRSEPMVKLLLGCGIDVEIRNNDGLTALHSACANDWLGSEAIVRLLLDGGANIHARTRDDRGKTALCLAIESDNTFAVIDLLEDRGATIDPPDSLWSRSAFG